MTVAYSGADARAHVGIPGSQWGIQDGPYASPNWYDVWGNITARQGWGGANPWFEASYTNNKRNGFSYDAAGNLLNDLGQNFTYNATGQQATASYGGYSLQQSYDGNGLRVKKVENGVTTYYLRSSVLGGQVAAELNGSGAWMRGYVYLGGELLAVQQSGVYWMHQEPVAKSKRVTAGAGNVVSTVELDPWGGDTSRSSNPGFQPRRFTSYERDVNGSDEAMFRRYNRWQSRFDQPDPYDGSYSLGDPQSFNRYAYVQNDPVNFVDPSGLDISLPLPFFHGLAPIGPPPSTVTIYGSFNSPLGNGGGVGVSDRDLMLDLVNIGTLSGGGDTPQTPETDIDKTWSREFECNRSANDLFRTLRRDFSRFANFNAPLPNRPGNAGIRFTPGPITQGRVINISAGGYSLSSGSVLIRSRNMSVTVTSASTTSFTFTTNLGHVLYPGTISFSAHDTSPGRVGASVTARGDFGDLESAGFFRLGGGRGFEDATWEHFLDNLQRSCGSLR